MSDSEACYHPGGVFGMGPDDLLPDDPEGKYKPILCPNCNWQLPSCQTNGYLCEGPEGSCLQDLSPPKRLIFIEAALGNCAGRCRGRLSHQERSEQTLICNLCVQRHEPVVRDLLRRVSENKAARHTRIDRGNGLEGICGNPQCEEIFPEEDLYSFPNELEHSLATICPKCYITATLVLLSKPYIERQMESLQRASEKTQAQSENTQIENTQAEDAQVDNTQAENPQVENTQIENIQAANVNGDSLAVVAEDNDSGYEGSNRGDGVFDVDIQDIDFSIDDFIDFGPEGMNSRLDWMDGLDFDGMNFNLDDLGFGFDVMQWGLGGAHSLPSPPQTVSDPEV